MKIEKVKLSQVAVNGANPRTITDTNFSKLVTSILVLPKMLELRPIVVDDTFKALGGNMRYKALLCISELSEDEIRHRLESSRDFQKKTDVEQEALVNYWLRWLDKPVAHIMKASELTDAEKQEFIIKDNVGFGDWDMDALANEWEPEDLKDWGVNIDWGGASATGSGGGSDGGGDDSKKGSLLDRFVIPPFSVLDTRKGYWQRRKKLWRDRIGDMGETRNGLILSSKALLYKDLYQSSRAKRQELGISFDEYLEKYVSDEVKEKEAAKVTAHGVSLFDPVLSECLCKWFTTNESSMIFDCFAGDTQKGLVFGMCGHHFTGIELREEQIQINNKVLEGYDLPNVRYINDDGQNVGKHIAPDSQDLLFSCPPYYDLEVYSDLPNDASNQGTYEDFLGIIRNAFSSAIKCLKSDRFAVIVVGDVRDRKYGFYYDFCGDIKRIFKENGMPLYNEIILVETGASTAMRAAGYMTHRKVAKMHQNILVFYKGNPRNIKNIFPVIEYTPEDEQAFSDAMSADGDEPENDNQ